MHSQAGTGAPAGTLIFRVALVAWALILCVWTVGLATQQEWATALWIWPQAPPLNHIFVASIAAAIAVPNIWIGISGEFGAAAPGALNLAVFSVGASWTLFRDPTFSDNPRVRIYAWVLALSVGVLAAVFAATRRVPLGDSRPTPALVRWSFALFAVALILVGSSLVLGAPHIFPWPLKPTHSAIYGWIFLGASIYFIHGFFRPCWANARGQLLGFLAYDVVLLGPYFAHLKKVLPAHQLSLTIYLCVLVYSTVLAVWFLFVSPSTRFRFGATGPAPAIRAA